MWWYREKSRKILAAVAVLAVVICLCSCRKGEEERMLAYMEKKYGEPFVQKEVYAGQFGKDYTMLRVQRKSSIKAQGMSGQEESILEENVLKENILEESILVRACGTENAVYQDNYLAYLLRDEVERKISALAKPVFGECKVFYKIPELVFPPGFPADMEADVFLRHPLSMVRVSIYVKALPEDVETQFQEFYRTVKEKGYFVGGVVSYPADEESYRMITAENFRGDIYRGYERAAELIFSPDEKGELAFRYISQSG